MSIQSIPSIKARHRPRLQMEGIEKSFPGVRALAGVDLSLYPGEVHALLGENGAGKSTLIKVLSGAHAPDAGVVRIDGAEVRFAEPADAEAAGVAVIYQELILVPALSATENIFLGCERTRGPFVRRAEERAAVVELFTRLGLEIDPDTPVGRLSIAQQQGVEIAKALSKDARILVMDEPSAALTPAEVDKLLALVEELKARGIGVIYISHRLDEIFRIADRVTVLRDGAHVETLPAAGLGRDRLIELMVGRKLEQEFPPREAAPGEVRLTVRGLTRRGAVEDVSFDLRRGEVLGLTGLVGSGRTETARLLFGADRADAGEVALDGRTLRLRDPRDAIREGVCLLTEDRKAEGLVLGLPVRENFGLPNLARFRRFGGLLETRAERAAFARYVDDLRIRIPHQDQLARNLSGGNQQKVVLAKWLFRNTEVVIFDEPTRGIDVGAKYEIYLLINRLAAEGKAVLMISSELLEVLGMSDRILVMHNGHISGQITDVPNATQEDLMRLAVA